MLNNDITLNAGTVIGTAGDKTYNLLPGTDTGTLRRVASTALTAPDTLRISHRDSKSGAITSDEHLVRTDVTYNDPLLGPVRSSVWIAMRIPRGTSVITNALVKTQLGQLISCLTQGTNCDKILAGEG